MSAIDLRGVLCDVARRDPSPKVVQDAFPVLRGTGTIPAAAKPPEARAPISRDPVPHAAPFVSQVRLGIRRRVLCDRSVTDGPFDGRDGHGSGGRFHGQYPPMLSCSLALVAAACACIQRYLGLLQTERLDELSRGRIRIVPQ